MTPATGTLDEAYERLHQTGPEFDGWLSNHGPMAAEALVRHGHGDLVSSWLDGYMPGLEDFPRGLGPIGADWQQALGDPRRVADWTAFFGRELGEQPWRAVLNAWWPRLLPGVVAAATHGVIRVGHAVRVLLADGEGGDDGDDGASGDADVRVTELAHGLGYWAARWQTVPAGHAGAAAASAAGQAHAQIAEPLATAGGTAYGHTPTGQLAATAGLAHGQTPAESLGAVPRIADQSGGIRDRLGRLGSLPGWPQALGGITVPAEPEQIRTMLAGLADAATCRYLYYGHGNGVMLVHSATAPTAIPRTLPALDVALWAPSLAAAWAASSALTAVYAPAEPAPRAQLPGPPAAGESPGETASATFARAAEHGDEHVIKFADTAVDVFARTGNPDAIAAALRATALIEP
jgi:Questin oxidase-like